MDWLNDRTRASMLQAFGDMLSDLSQDCTCATWASDTTEQVKLRCYSALMNGKAYGWGVVDDIITPHLAIVLIGMAAMLGGWPEFNMEVDGPRYVLDTELGVGDE